MRAAIVQRSRSFLLQKTRPSCSETVISSLAVFERLAKAGIAVHSYDCHGHGRSEPEEERSRALIWRFHHVVRLHLSFVVHMSCRCVSSLSVTCCITQKYTCCSCPTHGDIIEGLS